MERVISGFFKGGLKSGGERKMDRLGIVEVIGSGSFVAIENVVLWMNG